MSISFFPFGNGGRILFLFSYIWKVIFFLKGREANEWHPVANAMGVASGYVTVEVKRRI